MSLSHSNIFILFLNMSSSLVQNLHGAWLVVIIIGVRGNLTGFLYLTGIAVIIPSNTCLAFSASSGEISGSSHTPILFPIKDSKAKVLELTTSPHGTICFNPAINVDFPVLLGPHNTKVFFLEDVHVIQS